MDKSPTPKKSKPSALSSAVLALVLTGNLGGCAKPLSPPLSGPVRSVQLPPLPDYARQPTTPSECLPTCLDALTRERESWRTSLTSGTLQVGPVNNSTTPPAPN